MSIGYEGKLVKELEEKKHVVVEKLLLFEENESTIEYVCNGSILKEGSTFNDFYGEMTCKENAIKDAKELVKKLKLKKNSDLIIQVRVKTYNQKRKNIGSYWDGSIKYEIVGYPETTCEKIVWSSSKDTNCTKDGKVEQC